MSTPRLTFLYPFLFAPVRGAPFRGEVSKTGRQVFRTAARRSQTQRPVRYGKANEPLIYIGTDKGLAPSRPQDATAPPDARALPQPSNKTNGPAAPTSKESAPSHAPQSPLMDAQESHPTAPPSNTLNVPEKNALDTVLDVPQPDSKDASAPADKENKDKPSEDQQITEQGKDQRPRPPHIDTPAFVHHFDTYGLVKRLEDGGWTQAQAVTIMKAVRLTISENMDLASSALVSKSNVENETYLFKAACSELHTEIYTKRKGEAERSRTERTQLQHEVDILGQRLTQEGGNLKDELKGMFDDRKMAVQNEQRDIERKCQELNYRITISLNSDSRSDVENVRWLITKRAISALAICVAMILGSLKFSSTAQAWAEEEKKRAAAVVSNNPTNNNSGAGGHGGGAGGLSHQDEFVRDHANGGERREELGQGEILVRQGDNPAFVSLG